MEIVVVYCLMINKKKNCFRNEKQPCNYCKKLRHFINDCRFAKGKKLLGTRYEVKNKLAKFIKQTEKETGSKIKHL